MKNNIDGVSINYDLLIEAISQTFFSPSLYIQLGSLIACFASSYFLYKGIKKLVFPRALSRKLKRDNEFYRIINKYLSPLMHYLFIIIFLTIGLSIYSEFFKEAILFSTTLKFVTLFLFLKFIRISSDNQFVRNAAAIFFIPALIFDIFGILNTIISYLDSYSFEVGSVRISIYLVIKAFIVILIVFWVANLISSKFKEFLGAAKGVKPSTKSMISKVADIIIYSAVALILLKTFGVDLTTLAVFGGAIGVGIGFGLQKIASNFISGIILIFEKSIEVGDIVEVESGGNVFGTVKRFSGRYALIETFSGREILVPNEDLIVGKVINWTYSNDRGRIDVDLGVAYGTNLRKAQEIILKCANNHEDCLRYPEAECHVTEFGDSDIKFKLFFWIANISEGRFKAKSDIIMDIWDAFEEEGIKIPFPQRELTIVNDKQFIEAIKSK